MPRSRDLAIFVLADDRQNRLLHPLRAQDNHHLSFVQSVQEKLAFVPIARVAT
jgi:hypothetical protein